MPSCNFVLIRKREWHAKDERPRLKTVLTETKERLFQSLLLRGSRKVDPADDVLQKHESNRRKDDYDDIFITRLMNSVTDGMDGREEHNTKGKPPGRCRAVQ